MRKTKLSFSYRCYHFLLLILSIHIFVIIKILMHIEKIKIRLKMRHLCPNFLSFTTRIFPREFQTEDLIDLIFHIKLQNKLSKINNFNKIIFNLFQFLKNSAIYETKTIIFKNFPFIMTFSKYYIFRSTLINNEL